MQDFFIVVETVGGKSVTNGLVTVKFSKLRIYTLKPNPEVWYKQWKVRSGCLEKIALRNSEGHFFQTTP